MASPAPAPQFRLESGTSAEIPDVMTVMEAAFGTAYGEAWTRSQLAGILPMAGVALVVARTLADGQCVGFSLTRTVADEAELLLIAVLPEWQGNGAGQALLGAFIEAAETEGLARVHLEVRDGNRALAIYRDWGFEPVGRRRDYYRGADGRHDAITLARPIGE